MSKRIYLLSDQSQETPLATQRAGTILQLADGTIQFCDAIAAQLLGYPIDQLVGQTLDPSVWHLPPLSASALTTVEHPATTALKTGQPCCDVQVQYDQPDGKRIRLWVSATPLVQSSAVAPDAVVVTLTKYPPPGSQEQTQAQQFQEQIAATVPGMLYVYDMTERRNLYINRQVGEILGYSPEQIEQMGDRVLENLMHPDDLARVPSHFDRIRRADDGQVVELEYRMRRTNGEWCWLMARETVFHCMADRTPQQLLGIAQDITQRKQIEQQLIEQANALQESNDRFRLATMAVNGIVFEWNFRTGEVYRSPGLYELIGVSSAAAPATRDWWLERLHPDDYARFRAGIENPFLTDQRYEGEYRVRHEDGRWIDVWERGCVRYDEQGEPTGIVGFTTDITERKRTQTALESAYERMSIAQRCAKAGLWDWDVVRQEVFWSPEYYFLYGIRPTQTPSYEGWLASVVEEDRRRADQEIRGAIAQQQPIYTEFRYHHPEKGIRWFASIGNAIYSDSGKPTRVIGISLDITDAKQREAERNRIEAERRQAEAALQQSQAQFSLMLELLPQIFWTAHPNGAIDYYSPRWEEYIGFEQSRTMGWNWQSTLHPEDAQKTIDLWMQATQTGQFYECEHRIRRYDGEYRWHLSRAMPLRNLASEIIKWFGTAIDIQDLKEAEMERERLLQQEQTARIEADRANRIKDEFLAVLSHELRSPLNPILGWVKLLQSGRLDATKTREALATIERNVKLQTQLVEDLLDISRIMRGKLTLNTTPVDLAFVISSAIETVHLAADAKHIQIDCGLKAIAGQVLGDAARLQQVVWNLLSNAVKFTPQGGRVAVRLEMSEGVDEWMSKGVDEWISEGVDEWMSEGVDEWMSEGVEGMTGGSDGETSLTLPLSHPPTLPSTHPPIHPSTHPPSHPSPFAQITVTDTGKGIHPDFLPHVFEYFRQEDGSTTRQFGGLGLGLAIARQIVEMHGGIIRAESRGEGQGATFTVRLPLLYAQPTGLSQEADNSSSTLSASEINLLKGVEVLVVDDDDDSRAFLMFLLEAQGATVTQAASADLALQALERRRPDLILSDVGMPETNGYELMQRVRQQYSSQDRPIPAIALTAYATELDQQRAIAAGFQSHLSKPIDTNALIQLIMRLLKINPSPDMGSL